MRVARFFAGFLLLAILVANADFSSISDLLQQLRWFEAGCGFAIFLATGLLDMWRLRLASYHARTIDLWQFVRIHFESYILAQVLPGQVGMDVYRVGMIGKAGGGYLQSTAILLLLRAFSMFTMFFILIAALLLFPERNYLRGSELDVGNIPVWEIPVLLLVFLLGIWFIIRMMRGGMSQRLHARVQSVILACKEVPAVRLVLLVLISLVIIATRVASFYFTLRAMGAEIGFIYTITVALAASFAWLLPISPGGIGIREGIIVALLARAGIGFEQALLIALLNRIYFTLLGGFGGLLLLLPKNHSARDCQ